MATKSWFADSASLTVTSTADASPVPFAVLQEVEFTPSFEHVELYGMESVKRQAVAKHSLKVSVSAKFGAWDPSQDYLMWSILNGAFTTSATTGVNDSSANRNQEALFNVTATVKSTDGTSTVTVKAANVYFTEVPFKLTQHEFIIRDFKGTASDVTFTYS